MYYTILPLCAGSSTLDDVYQCIGTLPVFDENLTAVRLAGSNSSVVQCIVSDANTCFIESFVRHHDLSSCFDEIHTNLLPLFSSTYII